MACRIKQQRWRAELTAPLPMTRLAEVDSAIAVLRRAGATGRGTTLFASLGLHFNVDTPRLDAATITTVLKAFALLESWLRRNRLRRPPMNGSPA
jgi:hypothetical protein